jgi:deferrochelatase/peroxidase EfeB
MRYSFGFNDGLSQPAVKGVTTEQEAQPGQEFIHQGIALLGREGDNGDVDPPQSQPPNPLERPPWALDGSFLAFRYLRQLVPEFHAFLEANALEVPLPILPGDPNGAELLGARLVGRWPSGMHHYIPPRGCHYETNVWTGAPIDLTPIREDPSLAVPAKNQDFRFDVASQERCPYAAHLRKTNPRSDLDRFGGTELRRILRRGIPFGPEVTEEEKCQKKSSNDEKLERGLLFACYQSNLHNGFQFIQKCKLPAPLLNPTHCRWALTDYS